MNAVLIVLCIAVGIMAAVCFVLHLMAVDDKDTLLKMLIANTVTYENVESAKHEATDLVDYIIEKVDTLMDNKETEDGDE